MTECYIQEANSHAQHMCDDCGELIWGGSLEMISDIQERLTPNGVVPSGQCPHCGALTYELAEGETAREFCMPRLDVNSVHVRKALVRHREGYGEEAMEHAFHIASEEMGELLTAMNHYRRGRIGRARMLEEVADVMLAARLITELFSGVHEVELTLNAKAERFQPGRGGIGRRIRMSEVEGDDAA